MIYYEFIVPEVEPPLEQCCRDRGVPDVCFGYCMKEHRGPNEARRIQTGICKNWFKDIRDCQHGIYNKF